MLNNREVINYNSPNPSYNPFHWPEETLKNYLEKYLNGYKYYVLLLERLKKFLEEEWNQKILKRKKEKYPENITKWMKEELPKYQERVDYRVEETKVSCFPDKKIIFLSEQIKKGIREWNMAQPRLNRFW